MNTFTFIGKIHKPSNKSNIMKTILNQNQNGYFLVDILKKAKQELELTLDQVLKK